MNGDNFLLDTNTTLYLLGGDQTLADFLQSKLLYLSVISEIELLGYSKLSTKERLVIKSFISDSTIVELTNDVKQIAIELRQQYALKLGDSIIAATAKYTGLPFVTSDKGFNKVKGIDLVYYTK